MNHDEDKLTTQPETSNVNVSQDETINEEQSAQHNSTEESPSNEQRQNDSFNDDDTEKTWHNKNAMKRGIAMLGYGFIAGFVRVGITLIAVFQFFSLLFSEKPNQPLVKFGQNLNTYLYQINQFLTVNSEMYPFPFADWPDSAPKD
jgi:hypothetical protein